MKQRILNTLIAIDQLINTMLGGWADETLSARLWRVQHPAHLLVDAMFFWDRQGPRRHCQLSYESEVLRKHLPKGYRNAITPGEAEVNGGRHDTSR